MNRLINNSFVVYILFLLLLLSTILYAVKRKKAADFLISEQTNSLLINNRYESLVRYNHLVQRSLGQSFHPQVDVTDLRGNMVSLASLIDNKSVVVCFPEITCDQCYKTVLKVIEQIENASINKNFVILISFTKLKDVGAFIRAYGKEENVYNLNFYEIDLPLSEGRGSFVFTVNDENIVNFVFDPLINDQNYINESVNALCRINSFY